MIIGGDLMSRKKEVSKFLEMVRQSISRNQFDFITRDKKELTKLGISYREAIRIVENLQVDNFYRGPTKDHNQLGNLIYEFGYEVNNDLLLYIKLTYRKEDDLFIMSFHEATKEINYPYKKNLY